MEALARTTETPRPRGKHLADVGPPNEPWDAVVRHRFYDPRRKWLETGYRFRLTSRECAHQDLEETSHRQHGAHRATIFITEPDARKLQHMLLELHHRGWDDCTEVWSGDWSKVEAWTAAKLLALKWNDMKRVAADLTGNGNGSKGDVLGRLAEHLGIERAALGLAPLPKLVEDPEPTTETEPNEPGESAGQPAATATATEPAVNTSISEDQADELGLGGVPVLALRDVTTPSGGTVQLALVDVGSELRVMARLAIPSQADWPWAAWALTAVVGMERRHEAAAVLAGIDPLATVEADADGDMGEE